MSKPTFTPIAFDAVVDTDFEEVFDILFDGLGKDEPLRETLTLVLCVATTTRMLWKDYLAEEDEENDDDHGA